MSLSKAEMAAARAAIERAFNKYRALMELPLDFGTGEKLFPSEAHFIAALGAADTVTALAAALGVTKGAASQMATKLEAKGYARRRAGAGKEVRIELTARGRRALAGHAALHERMDAALAGALAGAGEEELGAFFLIMGKVEGVLDGWLAELERTGR